MATEGLHVLIFMSRSRERSEDNKLDNWRIKTN